jgi:thiol-disulfide isomerase/thioredoxin
MRTKTPLASLGVIFVAFTVLSCSKGGSGGGGGGTTPPPPTGTLKVVIDKATIPADNWETVNVTVTDQNNNDVTTSSSIYLGNLLMNGNTIFTKTPGTYQIKATRSGLTSPDVSLTATNPGPSPFSQKIIVEDFTGTWCGHCPRVGIKLEEYVNAGHPNCIVISNHGPSNDPYTFSNHAALASVFNADGYYPTVYVDRDFKWSENLSQLDQQFTNRRAPLGVAIQTSLTGNLVNVTAKVKFDVNTSVNLRVVAYLLQDGQVYPQVNYGYYSLPNPIPGYVHNGILRRTGTDLFGDDIPTASQTKGNIYQKTFALDATGYNVNQCRVVVFVVQGANNQGRKEKVVINAQVVKAGLTKDFD